MNNSDNNDPDRYIISGLKEFNVLCRLYLTLDLKQILTLSQWERMLGAKERGQPSEYRRVLKKLVEYEIFMFDGVDKKTRNIYKIDYEKLLDIICGSVVFELIYAIVDRHTVMLEPYLYFSHKQMKELRKKYEIRVPGWDIF